jgi:hypothetical protein
MILWRLLEFVCQNMTLPATSNSCLKYSQTNFQINVRIDTWYIEQLNNLYPKTSAGNTRPIGASDSFVAQTRQYGTNLISYNLFCDVIFSLMRIICYT